MKKALKITGIVIGALILILVSFYIKVSYSIDARRNTVYAVTPQPFDIFPDSSMLAEGKRLIVARGCNDCHGEDLGGKVMVDDFPMGFLVASNLTKGEGGLPADHNTTDWLLAIKHGIRRDGKPLFFMPAHEYTFLAESEMKAIIAYCQTVPAVDRGFPENEMGPLTKILADQDVFPLFPVEKIDHTRLLSTDIKPEVSVEFGKYISMGCQGCHQVTLKGGESMAPGMPVPADITSTGNPGKWTEEQFITTLRTGVTPEGKVLKQEEMPWQATKSFTDTELKALYLYLQSLK